MANPLYFENFENNNFFSSTTFLGCPKHCSLVYFIIFVELPPIGAQEGFYRLRIAQNSVFSPFLSYCVPYKLVRSLTLGRYSVV